MSARDELAHIIAVALTETNPNGTRAFDELSANRRKQLLSRGGHAADAILARYAAVELPEPDHEPLTYNGAGWTVPAPHHQVFDGYFEIESSDSEFGDEDAAEKFALALLACARHRRARIAANLPAGTLGRGEL